MVQTARSRARRSGIRAWALLCLVALPASEAAARTVRARVDLTDHELRTEEGVAGTRVSLRGLPLLESEGLPPLPAARRSFFVPEGYRVRTVRVAPRSEALIADGVQLDRQSRAAPAGPHPGVSGRGFPATAVSGVSRIHPRVPGLSLGGGNLGGFGIHSVELYPLRWEPSSGRLTLAREFDVELELEPVPEADRLVRQRESPEAREIFLRALSGIVENPGDLPGAAPPGGVEAGAFAPEELPSVDGSAVEMVIITTDALAGHFTPLAEWKTRKGVPAVVRSLEWIDTNYPEGLDRPERIRNFIRDAYAKWGVYLVLLGGDYDVVEPRGVWSVFYIGGTDVLSDQYFSCLDGNWNRDGDNKIGEGNFVSAIGDSADAYPDVFVGRASVSDSAEVATFVQKSMTYDQSPPAGYVEGFGGLGEVLFPSDWEFGQSPALITMDGKELILDSLDVEVPLSWTRSLRFQSDDDEDRTIALSELSTGRHLLTIMGHGDAHRFSAGNGSNPLVTSADTDTISNGDRLSFVVAVACNPNQFDLECQGESLMNNPDGGAIAVLGSSRVDFPQWSTQQTRSILRMAFTHGVTRLGAMSQLGRVPFADVAQLDHSPDRWTWLTKTLLGDPELRLWTAEPGNLLVSHATSVPLNIGSVTVTVTNTLLSPVSGALVCLSDGNGTYSRGYTDGLGQASLPVTSSGTGSVSVVVTRASHRPYQGSFLLSSPLGAHLARSAEVIDDDGAAPSAGNGNGMVDAGETIELHETVANGGTTPATDAMLIGLVEAGGSATFDLLWSGAADPSRVFVGPGRESPLAVPFTLDFASPAMQYIGRPTLTFHPDSAAADSGIFVWQDREGWHLLWSAGGDTVTVSGTVTTDGRVRNPSALGMEASDTFSSSGDSLTFSGATGSLDLSDGIDFGLSDSTMITLTQATDSLGTISGSADATGTLVLDVSTAARRGQVAYVDLTFTAASGGPWTGLTQLLFAGPELEAYLVAVQDSGTGLVGDGDGVIEVGETVRLTPTVINRGTGSADAVTGLATAASGIAFMDSTDAYGDIASAAEGAGTDGYVFTVSDSTGTSLTLDLTDSVGRTWGKTVDFVGPQPPDSLWFSSDARSIRIDWTPGIDADLAGYNVYRSLFADSGHVKLSYGLVTLGSRFTDHGLALGATHFYRVTSVDSSGNESPLSGCIEAWTTQPQVSGWPQVTGSFIYPGILMEDADRNGLPEVYVGDHAFDFHGWRPDGSARPGFPQGTGHEIWSTAAMADVDREGNGDREIFWGSRDGNLYGVRHDGSPVVGDSTVFASAQNGIRSAVTIADVTGDGSLEILFGTDGGDVYAFRSDGTGLTGGTGLLYATTGTAKNIWGLIAVGDLDADGSPEIVFSSWNDRLYAIDATGADRPGFPRQTSADFRGGPVLGDLDADGTLEIVAGNFAGDLHVFDHDGSDYVPGGILATLPEEIFGAAALANVDGDPELEIFVGCFDGNLYAFHHDGTSLLPGQAGVFASLPKGPGANDGISASPIVVDVDGDADFEILVGHRNFNFYAFHHDGTRLPGLPIPTGNGIFSTAAAGDLDGDGDVDVAFASYDGTVNVLDFPGASTPDAYEWPMLGGNIGRTGLYGDAGPGTSAPRTVVSGRFFLALSRTAPNPFVRSTTISYVSPGERKLTLGVYSVSGRLVRTLLSDAVPPGPGSVRWDGRDAGGRAVASGIYFYRLDDGHESITRKGVLLR